MGLEALVESYAFWRPSLRTLTFEDIPGIAKQGREPQEVQLLIAALAGYCCWFPTNTLDVSQDLCNIARME